MVRKIIQSTLFLILLPLILSLSAVSSPAGECTNWQSVHPDWIWCDDFEASAVPVGSGGYFEYVDSSGGFVLMDTVGFQNSRGMRALWKAGQVDAGSLKLSFGRNPSPYMNTGNRPNEDFREIYYRMYLRMQPGWQGNPVKLSRATVISKADWSQAMIAHLWGDSTTHLLIDPASCTDASGNVVCSGYNDFPNIQWLGNRSGVTPLFDGNHNDRWLCVEHHVKLNDPGQSNGIQEFWIDGGLEAQRTGLDFVGNYTAYGINAVFFENYWNSGSPVQQERYFDNIVVSTQPVGCDVNSSPDTTPPAIPTGLVVQ